MRMSKDSRNGETNSFECYHIISKAIETHKIPLNYIFNLIFQLFSGEVSLCENHKLILHKYVKDAKKKEDISIPLQL